MANNHRYDGGGKRFEQEILHYYTERTDKKAMNINVDNKEGAEILDC